MSKILEKLYSATTLGVILAILAMVGLHYTALLDTKYLSDTVPFFVFLHVLAGITWIGLLYYFNVVQMPTMPSIPADLKPGVSKYIAPAALFWFRWAALATVVTGIIVKYLNNDFWGAMTLQPQERTIGIGMWLGLIMAFNVWAIIWPNQKKALGLVKVADAEKAKAARIAMLTSRVNFVLSFPMLYCMVSVRWLG